MCVSCVCVCVGKLCVSKLWVWRRGGGRRRRRRTEVHNQKQEPDTMMWGKTQDLEHVHCLAEAIS